MPSRLVISHRRRSSLTESKPRMLRVARSEASETSPRREA